VPCIWHETCFCKITCIPPSCKAEQVSCQMHGTDHDYAATTRKHKVCQAHPTPRTRQARGTDMLLRVWHDDATWSMIRAMHLA